MLDDPYNPNYIRIEEENDLWDETLDDPNLDPEITELQFLPRMFLKRNIYN